MGPTCRCAIHFNIFGKDPTGKAFPNFQHTPANAQLYDTDTVVVSQKLGRKYHTNRVMNLGPATYEITTTLIARPQLRPLFSQHLYIKFNNENPYEYGEYGGPGMYYLLYHTGRPQLPVLKSWIWLVQEITFLTLTSIMYMHSYNTIMLAYRERLSKNNAEPFGTQTHVMSQVSISGRLKLFLKE